MPEIPAQAEQAISKAAQGAVGEFFWTTVWIPFASYLWTLAWIVAGILIKKKLGEDTQVKLLSKAQVVVMIVFDFIWFVLIAFFVSMVAIYICHGDGSFLGGIAAFLTRTAAKVGSLGAINFDFCDQIPKIPF